MDAETLYGVLADELCETEGVEPSTMMGFPCLRHNGDFFASWDPRAHRLIVKIPAERVEALIHDRIAVAFSPNGRRFKEWAAIPEPEEATWRTLLQEARTFVTQQRAS